MGRSSLSAIKVSNLPNDHCTIMIAKNDANNYEPPNPLKKSQVAFILRRNHDETSPSIQI